MRGKPCWWDDKLRGFGWRITAPRQAILDLLNSTSKHLSAEDIYFEVHKKYPATGLTTVYRTLDMLEQRGLVFKFDFGDGRARFELAEDSKGKKHHHHLVCTDCGRIIDYTDFIDDEIKLLQLTEKGLSKKYNFQISGHLIQFYGLCDKCR